VNVTGVAAAMSHLPLCFVANPDQRNLAGRKACSAPGYSAIMW
jgi:hypothetical protein